MTNAPHPCGLSLAERFEQLFAALIAAVLLQMDEGPARRLTVKLLQEFSVGMRRWAEAAELAARKAEAAEPDGQVGSRHAVGRAGRRHASVTSTAKAVTRDRRLAVSTETRAVFRFTSRENDLRRHYLCTA